MRRYFFDTVMGDLIATDEDGQELDSIEIAEIKAIEIGQEILAHQPLRPHSQQCVYVGVRAAGGEFMIGVTVQCSVKVV